MVKGSGAPTVLDPGITWSSRRRRPGLTPEGLEDEERGVHRRPLAGTRGRQGSAICWPTLTRSGGGRRTASGSGTHVPGPHSDSEIPGPGWLLLHALSLLICGASLRRDTKVPQPWSAATDLDVTRRT